MIRINKYLSQCGVTSRRSADLMVTEGRVTINGVVITTPGHMVNEEGDQVTVDGRPVALTSRHVYIVLNKPAGYVTSRSDPYHKRTVMELLKDLPDRVNPVGRLDLDTTGVLLFTNDGELAHRLTHPRFAVAKVYRAKVAGDVPRERALILSGGVALPDGTIGRAQASIEGAGDGYTVLRLELTEGRKREVKHLCKAIGHSVIELNRQSFAGIDATGLEIGKWRYLTAAEIDQLRRLVKLDAS